jgi:hypothetical protein
MIVVVALALGELLFGLFAFVEGKTVFNELTAAVCIGLSILTFGIASCHEQLVRIRRLLERPYDERRRDDKIAAGLESALKPTRRLFRRRRAQAPRREPT